MKLVLTEFVSLDGVSRVTPNGLVLLEYNATGIAPVAEYEGVTAYV